MRMGQWVLQASMWVLLVATAGVLVFQTEQISSALSDYYFSNWRVLFWGMPVITVQLIWLGQRGSPSEIRVQFYKLCGTTMRLLVLALALTAFFHCETLGAFLSFDAGLADPSVSALKEGKGIAEAVLTWFAISVAALSTAAAWKNVSDRY